MSPPLPRYLSGALGTSHPLADGLLVVRTPCGEHANSASEPRRLAVPGASSGRRYSPPKYLQDPNAPPRTHAHHSALWHRWKRQESLRVSRKVERCQPVAECSKARFDSRRLHQEASMNDGTSAGGLDEVPDRDSCVHGGAGEWTRTPYARSSPKRIPVTSRSRMMMRFREARHTARRTRAVAQP